MRAYGNDDAMKADALEIVKAQPSSDGAPDRLREVQVQFVKNSGRIKGFIISLVPGFSDADDILQETFLTVTAKAEQFEPGTDFMAWACTIARFKVLEALRKAKRNPDSLSPEIVELLADEMPEEALDPALTGALKRCIEKLSPRVQTMLKLRYNEEQKPGRIAEQIGWTPNAVYVALSRSRTVLRECINKDLRRQARGKIR